MIGAYDPIMKADAEPELRHLRALRAVAEEGSFAGAAAVLGCSQPAVSQQIAQLETHLGVPVLHRRPLRLTDAGRVLLAAGKEVVTVLAAAQAEIAAISEGEAGEGSGRSIRLRLCAAAPNGAPRLSANLPGRSGRVGRVRDR